MHNLLNERDNRNDVAFFMDPTTELHGAAIVGHARRFPLSNPRPRKLCVRCKQKKSISVFRGRPACRKHHELCSRCFRRLLSSFAALTCPRKTLPVESGVLS